MDDFSSASMFDIDSITTAAQAPKNPVALHHDLMGAPLVNFWRYSLYFSSGLFISLLVGTVPLFMQLKMLVYVFGCIYVMLYKNPNITINWQPRVALIVGAYIAIEFLIHTIKFL